MPNPILRDDDRRVKVFSNGTPVSSSPLQSVYAKYLNFIGLTVTENAPLNAYDVSAGAATDEKVISYINGTQVGSVARRLNFSTDFTGSDDAGNGRTNIGLATPAANILLPDGTTTTKSKVGTFYGGGLNGNGILAGVVTHGTLGVDPDAAALYTTFDTPATDNELAGFSTQFRITRRAYNPTYKIQFKNEISTERMFAGFHSDLAHPINTSNPLDSKTGAGVGYDDADANFMVWHNNGTASSIETNTGVAKNTTVHTAEFILNDTAGTVTIKFDGTTVVNASTTQVPASATDMAIHSNMEAVGSTITPFDIGYAYIIQDK